MDKENVILNFKMSFITPVTFKENEVNIIQNLIKGSRIGKYLTFESNCVLIFNDEDKKHDNPKVEFTDKFKRGKINCLCFKNNSIIDSKPTNNYYDYIFIYQTNYQDNGFYGIIGYIDETQQSTHLYGLNHEYTNLIVNMQRLAQRQKQN